eukprot:NODE_288_length_11703_cov_0.386591.p11 type:complete len:103 gc:universal NODE_288_length_11703_cov_0.386591:6265-6573(+)
MKGSPHQWYRFHTKKLFYSVQKSTTHGLMKGFPIGLCSFGIFSLHSYLKPTTGIPTWICIGLFAAVPLSAVYPSKQVFRISVVGGLLLSGLDASLTYLKGLE